MPEHDRTITRERESADSELRIVHEHQRRRHEARLSDNRTDLQIRRPVDRMLREGQFDIGALHRDLHACVVVDALERSSRCDVIARFFPRRHPLVRHRPSVSLNATKEYRCLVDAILDWDSLCRYLEKAHTEVQTYEGYLLRFTYRANGYESAIGGYLLSTSDQRPWLVLALKLGPRDDLRPRPALIANYDLPIGAIGILRSEGIVRHSMPLAGLLPSTLERALKALVGLAMQLRAARDVNDDADIDSPYAYIYR